ncbi:MAG: cation:proton antiporter [Gammaproteobacteria bacterium]
MNEMIVISLAGIGIVALACQWLAWWIKLPAILFLLLAGLLLGPVTGLIHPDKLFGDLLFPVVSLSVAVVLFEGSLTLKFREIKGLEKVVQRLLSIGVLTTWAITTLATYLLLSIPFELALLFGALTVVTGPTVIVPMLRTVRPTARLSNILRWEGIVIDPIGALLAVLVFEFIISGSGVAALGHTLLSFAGQVSTGLVIGAVSGYGWGTVLRRHWLPEFLHKVATLMIVFGVFALSNQLQSESLSIVLISGLFIILATRIDFTRVTQLGWHALGVLLVMQFVARPVKVLVATWGSSLSWRERTLLAWIAPRGIVAAAIAALFALQLEQQAYPGATLLVPMTFIIILGTVTLQSATARMLAMWLGVAEPEPTGFLIVGANPLARAIARALDKNGFHVQLADTSWSNIRNAVMDNLPTYYGNVVSEDADRRLDLVGIGQLLALSSVHEENALAASRYRSEFGAANIYSLQITSEREGDTKTGKPRIGQLAFGEAASYKSLSAMLGEGAEVRSTSLSDEFGFDEYYKQYFRAVPLFAINPRGKLSVYTDEHELKPAAGWTIISLIPQSEPEVSEATNAKAP